MSNKLNFHFERDFTVVPNILLRDKRLSYKAKGIFLQIISVPESWNFSVRGLCALAKESTRAVTSGLRELENCGYIEWTKSRTAFNKFNVEVNVFLPEPSAVLPQDKMPCGKMSHNKEQIDKSILGTQKNDVWESVEGQDNVVRLSDSV